MEKEKPPIQILIDTLIMRLEQGYFEEYQKQFDALAFAILTEKQDYAKRKEIEQ